MTHRVYLDWVFDVTRTCSDEELATEVEQVMAELLALEGSGLANSAVSLNLLENQVQIEVTYEADSHDEAILEGMSCIRAAIHAAGGATPHWPDLREGTLTAEPIPA